MLAAWYVAPPVNLLPNDAVEGFGVIEHQYHAAVVGAVVVDVMYELAYEYDIFIQGAVRAVAYLGVTQEVLHGYVKALRDAFRKNSIRYGSYRDGAVHERVRG